MVRNRYETDYTDQMKSIYNTLSSKFGYSARITDIWPLLLASIGKDEFEILDLRNYNNGGLEAYLIDTYVQWREGKGVDFSEVYNEILRVGDFTAEEKHLLGEESENILWAIYLDVLDPSLKL